MWEGGWVWEGGVSGCGELGVGDCWEVIVGRWSGCWEVGVERWVW